LVTARVGRKEEQKRKDFFSEEKKQKTFFSGVQEPVQMGASEAAETDKSFLLLFFKKEAFFLNF